MVAMALDNDHLGNPSKRYDAILTDDSMPEYNGDELLHRVRHDPLYDAYQDTPVIVWSKSAPLYREDKFNAWKERYPQGEFQDLVGKSHHSIEMIVAKLDETLFKDAAMLKPTGGIDLKDSAGATHIRKDGNGVEFAVDPAMIERVRREGVDSLTPLILRIEPVTDIWPLLGLAVPKK